jgi:two-component system, OmpR family, sensor kinase
VHPPIRVRLTLIFLVLVGILLSGVGLLLYLRLGADLTDAIDAGLRSRSKTVLAALRTGGKFNDKATAAEFDQSFVQILRRDGSVRDSSSALGLQPVLSPRQVGSFKGSLFFERQIGPATEPVSARFLAIRTRRGSIVVVGQSMEQRAQALGRLLKLLVVALPASILTVAFVGYLLTAAALRPVERMREEAATISSTEPGRRLSIPTARDEVRRLGNTLNAMLGRLEDALTRERRLVDDASHELRTPLAILRTELELAVNGSRSSDELALALSSALEETIHLDRLTEDLLVLARTEHGASSADLQMTRLADTVREACDRFGPRAEAAGVTLLSDVDDETILFADPIRLRQALDNLLENSLRHVLSGGEIMLSADRDDGQIWLKVSDDGDGFPDAFLAHAFEPFTRSDSGRGRDNGGAGLGLSIVRSIADSHGGSATARNLPGGGAEVTLRFPRDRPG